MSTFPRTTDATGKPRPVTDGGPPDLEPGDRAVDRESLVESFKHSDPALTPAEKETVFRFARGEGRLNFFSAERGVGRRLILHPDAVLDAVVVKSGDARPAKDPAAVQVGEDIVGVRGTLPIGALSVLSKPRKSDQHADIVSDRVLEEVGE
jgi:hypothetical protein